MNMWMIPGMLLFTACTNKDVSPIVIGFGDNGFVYAVERGPAKRIKSTSGGSERFTEFDYLWRSDRVVEDREGKVEQFLFAGGGPAFYPRRIKTNCFWANGGGGPFYPQGASG
jgi:hypothetical protein